METTSGGTVVKAMPYTIIDHTADMGVKVSADTLEELFEEAACALADIIGGRCEQGTDEIRLEARGIDPEDLLVRWLQEILYLMEVRGWRLTSVHMESLGNTSARGVFRGECSHEPLIAEVKAVTYHNLVIVHIDNTFQVTIILDM